MCVCVYMCVCICVCVWTSPCSPCVLVICLAVGLRPSRPACLWLQVPYDDLRYLFGEIMYGGHITDDWDRRLCRTYLEEFIKPEMLEGELFLAPSFPLPGNMDYNGYHQYIDDVLPAESPYLYGLHPNAEIGFLTQTSEKLFRTVLEMQPRDSSMGEGGGSTREEKTGLQPCLSPLSPSTQCFPAARDSGK
ncbi:hypothetical protein FKM82_029070 [Ascaphus truei]